MDPATACRLRGDKFITTGRPIMMKTIFKGAPLALAFAFATPAFAGT